jgi:hypothetical protein
MAYNGFGNASRTTFYTRHVELHSFGLFFHQRKKQKRKKKITSEQVIVSTRIANALYGYFVRVVRSSDDTHDQLCFL